MKILIVDDSKAMRMIVPRAPAHTDVGAGAKVLEAPGGREALDLVRSQQPDVVLPDWSMPQMTGMELRGALQAQASPVAFGFVTFEATPETHERAPAGGARFTVTEPLGWKSLGRALEELR